MAIPDLLRGCPLFHELMDKEVEKIVQSSHVYTFNEGEQIIKDGEEGDEIFVVLDGSAMVQKDTPQGVIKIQQLQQGDVFGEMVLIDERIRSADIISETHTNILEIKYENIFGLFKNDPKIFGLMILNLSRLLAKRLRGSNKIIVKLKDKISELG
jgi:CRP-like cAMP-binding protein